MTTTSLTDVQDWMRDMTVRHGFSRDPHYQMTLLTEELGELAKVVRRISRGQIDPSDFASQEEFADVLITLAGAVASFRVASTPRYFDKQTNEWKDGEGLFLTCTIWRQAAENVAESLTRGMRVIVQGRLKQRSYETREGEKRTVYEVEADEVGPSLKSATAKVTKAQRSGGGFGQDAPPQGGRQGGQRDTYGGQGRQAPPAGDPWATSTAGPSDDSPPF